MFADVSPGSKSLIAPARAEWRHPRVASSIARNRRDNRRGGLSRQDALLGGLRRQGGIFMGVNRCDLSVKIVLCRVTRL